MVDKNTLRNAVIGAVVTVVLSFTGFSPILGGGVAGYLQREPPRRGARVGALSGAIAALPFVLVLLVGMVLFAAIPSVRLGVPGAMELVIIVFVIFPLLFAWNIGLGALGGYVGAALRSESGPGRGATTTADVES